MAVRITHIKKDNGNHENPHLAISAFKWINEQSQESGSTKRELMYDWIVNKAGKAYVRDTSGNTASVLGAISPLGNGYLRTVSDGKWSDNLLSLPEF